MAARDHVLSVLRDCFQRHGAVPMCSQDVGLASDADPPGAVQLLTPAGSKLALVSLRRAGARRSLVALDNVLVAAPVLSVLKVYSRCSKLQLLPRL